MWEQLLMLGRAGGWVHLCLSNWINFFALFYDIERGVFSLKSTNQPTEKNNNTMVSLLPNHSTNDKYIFATDINKQNKSGINDCEQQGWCEQARFYSWLSFLSSLTNLFTKENERREQTTQAILNPHPSLTNDKRLAFRQHLSRARKHRTKGRRRFKNAGLRVEEA